jgi:hypothetical protein
MNLLGFVLPGWVKYAALFFAAISIYFAGRLDGERIEGAKHLEYVAQQSQKALKIHKAQEKVVVKTEIVYRDRIKKIYVKGDVIEKEVPVYVTKTDNERCTVNAGFVRSYNAGWTGEPAGPPAESDREPSGISLAEVAETDAYNAKVALAWKEQALGLRKLYEDLKAARESQ